MADKHFRLVDTDLEPIGEIIDTAVSRPSERMQYSLDLSPIFKIIVDFWVKENVTLMTACRAVTQFDTYIPFIQELERRGESLVPANILYSKEPIKTIELKAIKHVIFPYYDYREKTGISLLDEDLEYIWEFLLEVYRANFHKDNLSRFNSIFLFGNRDNMQSFNNNYHLFEGLTECECNLLETRRIEKHDMNWIDDIPIDCTFKEYSSYAENYWTGETSENPTFEYLFSGKYQLNNL